MYSLLAYSDTCVWSGSWDKTIIVWNTNTKEPTQVRLPIPLVQAFTSMHEPMMEINHGVVQVLQDVHDDAISALVAVPGATQRFWSASWDKSLCVWE